MVDDTGGDIGTLNGGWTLTITIATVAQPGQLQFSAAGSISFEGAGNAPITITRTGGSDGAVSVNFATLTSGTATAGSDFTAVNQTVDFAAGQTSATVNVPVR